MRRTGCLLQETYGLVLTVSLLACMTTCRCACASAGMTRRNRTESLTLGKQLATSNWLCFVNEYSA